MPEEECPEPKPGEVRVRVLAAGVSLPDMMMREGMHPETPRLPFTPGWDLVGVVLMSSQHGDRGDHRAAPQAPTVVHGLSALLGRSGPGLRAPSGLCCAGLSCHLERGNRGRPQRRSHVLVCCCGMREAEI